MSPISFVVLALCGLALGAVDPLSRLDSRIVGGELTTIAEHPYLLSIRNNKGIHFCGASILGPYHALTAAHCVREGSAISVHAGTTFKSRGGSKHDVVKVTVHPQYQGDDYDFAIIEVKTKFLIGQIGIQRVKLCSVEPSAGQTAVISGWGDLIPGVAYPDQLRAAKVPIISREACQDKYNPRNITDRMICAAMENGAKDVCHGDDGGPLIVDGKQCGVVSWSNGCGDAKRPGVYSNVADQLSWIQATAGL